MEFLLISIAAIVVSYFYIKYAPMHDLTYVINMRNAANEKHRNQGENESINIKVKE